MQVVRHIRDREPLFLGMRLQLCLLVVASGCAMDAPEPDIENVEKGCIDPGGCNTGNHGGTYTDENGYAGIGSTQFLITHFINSSGGVSIEGRYLYAQPNDWRAGS